MSTPTAAISSTELRDRLDSPTAPTVLDVRTPAEFETAHITRSYNVPLDVLGKNTSEVVENSTARLSSSVSRASARRKQRLCCVIRAAIPRGFFRAA
jgi:rhodanese-related sulfurtransferase